SPATFGSQAAQLPAAFLAMLWTGAGSFERTDVGFEMPGERCTLVPAGGILAGRHHPRPHQLGAAFEVGQHTAGSLLVPAAGRHGLHDASPVAVLGDEVRRFGQDSCRALLPLGPTSGA